ncbi:hypothetical protein [Microscilla marina]|uniref:Uncharacterized protein n=1 Tax=Microscilla marina ATCC 23134 TaxID=313606 RepID=A1ZYX7_MICM2|nr:hypothetical protein [Microscilla marina]EAY24413.1 hypothetical protein M23134_01753 [Microscilla marina ATCC 23134]
MGKLLDFGGGEGWILQFWQVFRINIKRKVFPQALLFSKQAQSAKGEGDHEGAAQ